MPYRWQELGEEIITENDLSLEVSLISNTVNSSEILPNQSSQTRFMTWSTYWGLLYSMRQNRHLCCLLISRPPLQNNGGTRSVFSVFSGMEILHSLLVHQGNRGNHPNSDRFLTSTRWVGSWGITKSKSHVTSYLRWSPHRIIWMALIDRVGGCWFCVCPM